MIERFVETAKNKLIVSQLGSSAPITFVSPILSTILAASKSAGLDITGFQFSGNAAEYAVNNNLKGILDGNYSAPENTGRQGVTYTKLTRLSNHSEVDWCNKIINDLIHSQFATYSQRAVSMMGKVVGELHDNVPSHASGAGYSCAQVYNTNGDSTVVFSIADCGRGMLANVNKVMKSIETEADAIRWCLEKGNTSAKSSDQWAQWLPDDAIISPYPLTATTLSEENHHVGHGLWQLCELIKEFQGKVWILSGSPGKCAEYWYNCGQITCRNLTLKWQGVAIAFQLVVPKGEVATNVEEASLKDLGRRLGI